MTKNLSKRAYTTSLIIRGKQIDWIVISSHYEINHSVYMTDEIILELVEKHLENNEPRFGEKKSPWKYLTWEPLEHEDNFYRLITCSHEKQTNFLGIVNCHRLKKSKYGKK